MNVEKLKEILQNQGADFEIIKHDKPIKSKKDAIIYFDLKEMAPTLIIKADENFYALIVSGEREVIKLEQIKKLLGCDKIGMADRNLIKEKLGLEAGQVPLIGHNLSCVVDNWIFNYKYVYGGTGDLLHTLKISPSDLAKANNVILKFD